jgi:hypothetical protein
MSQGGKMQTKRYAITIECPDTVAYDSARLFLKKYKSQDPLDLLDSMIWLRWKLPDHEQIPGGFHWSPELTADLLNWEPSKVVEVLDEISQYYIRSMCTMPGHEHESVEAPIVYLGIRRSMDGKLKDCNCYVHPDIPTSAMLSDRYPEIEKRFGGGDD